MLDSIENTASAMHPRYPLFLPREENLAYVSPN